MRTAWHPPRWARAVFTAGVGLLAVAVWAIASDPVATGYEFSFFRAYPLWFWGTLVLAMVLGVLLLFGNAFDDQRSYWPLGVLLVGAVDLVLLIHPHVRYALYGRGDVLTHVGSVRQIVATGAFMETNYYPVVHVFGALLAEFAALSPTKATGMLPVVFSVVYLASFVYLAGAITPNRSTFLLVVAVGMLPLLGTAHTYAAPSAISFFLVPLVAYLYLKLHDGHQFRTYAVPLVLLVVTVVFFHPITFLYLLSFLLAIRGTNAVADRVDGLSMDVPNAIRSPAPLLGFTLFVWWYGSARTAVRSVVSGLGPLVDRGGGGRFAHLVDVTSTYTPRLADIITVAVVRYGRLALLAAGAVVMTGAYALLRWRRRRPLQSNVVALASIVAVFLPVTAAAFFLDLLIPYYRAARLLVLTAPLLIGVGLASVYDWPGRSRLRRALTVLVVCGLVALVVLSVVNLHLSPLSRDDNKQVTEMELAGSEWFYEHREGSLLIDELGFKQFRFYGATGEAYTRADLYDDVVMARERNLRLEGTRPPNHFGYGINATLGETYGDDRYLVVTKLGRERYPELYPEYPSYWRFVGEDFRELNRDPSVVHAYDNGEFDVYRVDGALDSPSAASP